MSAPTVTRRKAVGGHKTLATREDPVAGGQSSVATQTASAAGGTFYVDELLQRIDALVLGGSTLADACEAVNGCPCPFCQEAGARALAYLWRMEVARLRKLGDGTGGVTSPRIPRHCVLKYDGPYDQRYAVDGMWKRLGDLYRADLERIAADYGVREQGNRHERERFERLAGLVGAGLTVSQALGEAELASLLAH